ESIQKEFDCGYGKSSSVFEANSSLKTLFGPSCRNRDGDVYSLRHRPEDESCGRISGHSGCSLHLSDCCHSNARLALHTQCPRWTLHVLRFFHKPVQYKIIA
ncbi:unnamed protein product, partial [Lymnaea stagnalis]